MQQRAPFLIIGAGPFGLSMAAYAQALNIDLNVRLDNGQHLNVDHVIAATGYKVNMEQAPFLARGNMLPLLTTANGFPVLDEQFQTSIPGLFATSMMATQDFGPFFGFTVAVRSAAKIVGAGLQKRVNMAR